MNRKNLNNKLIIRNNLSRTDLSKRLLNYFTEDEVNAIIANTILFDNWTNGDIAITLITKNNKIRFNIITTYKYGKLLL